MNTPGMQIKGTPHGRRSGLNIFILSVLVLVVAATIGIRMLQKATGAESIPARTVALPRLVDLGAAKCIPCKMMAPILNELKQEYAGVLDVEFIDVWKNPGAGEVYDVRIIPTQIFYHASGKELYRHQGFYAKEDILAKWKELGVKLSK